MRRCTGTLREQTCRNLPQEGVLTGGVPRCAGLEAKLTPGPLLSYCGSTEAGPSWNLTFSAQRGDDFGFHTYGFGSLQELSRVPSGIFNSR